MPKRRKRVVMKKATNPVTSKWLSVVANLALQRLVSSFIDAAPFNLNDVFDFIKDLIGGRL